MNHLIECTCKECHLKHMCKRYTEKPTRQVMNFKWLFENRGWKCFVYQPKENEKKG